MPFPKCPTCQATVGVMRFVTHDPHTTWFCSVCQEYVVELPLESGQILVKHLYVTDQHP